MAENIPDELFMRNCYISTIFENFSILGRIFFESTLNKKLYMHEIYYTRSKLQFSTKLTITVVHHARSVNKWHMTRLDTR